MSRYEKMMWISVTFMWIFCVITLATVPSVVEWSVTLSVVFFALTLISGGVAVTAMVLDKRETGRR